MISYVSKLMALTNTYIEAAGATSAKDIRDRLIEDIFPLLTAIEKAELSKHTEYENTERFIRQNFGDALSDQAVIDMIPKIIHILREDAIERRKMGSSYIPKNEP